MFDTASPSLGSLRREPMTIAQIDSHPDCDRIWATIAVIQREMPEEYQRGYSEAESEIDDAVASVRIDCRDELAGAIRRIEACAENYREAEDPLAAILSDVSDLGDLL